MEVGSDGEGGDGSGGEGAVTWPVDDNDLVALLDAFL
jgi:hypothetical protein